MQTVVTLYVYSKNLNLHAISALEAIHDLLGKKQVSFVNRYVKWDLVFNTEESRASGLLDEILSNTFYLLNPNKEDCHKGTIPTTSHQRFVTITRDFDHHQPELCEMLRSRFSSDLVELKKSYVWDIQFSFSDNIDQIVDEITHSQSISQGILANPIYETCRITTSV